MSHSERQSRNLLFVGVALAPASATPKFGLDHGWPGPSEAVGKRTMNMEKKREQMKQPTLASGILLVLASCAAYGQPIEFNHPPVIKPVDTGCDVHPVDPASSPSAQWLAEWQGRCLAVMDDMRYPSPLSPIGDGRLSMMGDEAAFHLFSIMMQRPPLTPAQTLTVLDIIHNSFKNPAFIQSHADRKPEKSLALLKIIQATAVDQLVKERIAAETTFLTTLPATITPVPILNLPAKPGVMPMREDFPGMPPLPAATGSNATK